MTTPKIGIVYDNLPRRQIGDPLRKVRLSVQNRQSCLCGLMQTEQASETRLAETISGCWTSRTVFCKTKKILYFETKF